MLEKTDKVDKILQQAAKVLAANTNYATMVSAPVNSRNTLKFIQLSQVDEEQIVAVEEVLEQINAQTLPRVLVFNKCDLLTIEQQEALANRYDALLVSAETGEGIDQLVDRIAHVASAQDTHLDVVVPYQRGDLVSKAHERCRILTEEHIETGTHLTMLVPKAYVDEFRSLSDAKQ